MAKNQQDNIDIVDALRYTTTCSLNKLRHVIQVFTIDFKTCVELLKALNNELDSLHVSYHKTKQFRRKMYYLRYERRSYRLKKRKKKNH